jgi:hypothetical protein
MDAHSALTDRPSADPPQFDSEESAWALISKELGIPLAGLTRLDADEPAYEIHLTSGSLIYFSCIDHLISQTKCRSIIAAATHTLMPKKTASRWDNIIRAALTFLHHDTAGYETTLRGQISDWLYAYLRNSTPATAAKDAIQAGSPWIDDQSRTLITAASLRYWIAIHYQERVTPRNLGLALRAIGATAIHLPPGTGSSSAWILPKEITP